MVQRTQMVHGTETHGRMVAARKENKQISNNLVGSYHIILSAQTI